jgi:hypothetical protein
MIESQKPGSVKNRVQRSPDAIGSDQPPTRQTAAADTASVGVTTASACAGCAAASGFVVTRVKPLLRSCFAVDGQCPEWDSRPMPRRLRIEYPGAMRQPRQGLSALSARHYAGWAGSLRIWSHAGTGRAERWFNSKSFPQTRPQGEPQHTPPAGSALAPLERFGSSFFGKSAPSLDNAGWTRVRSLALAPCSLLLISLLSL